MRKWYVDRVHETSTRVCTRCGHPLAFVAEVGWVDTSGGDYDMCEADAYANHLPGPALARRPAQAERSTLASSSTP